jgi:DNA polymerase
LQQQITLIKPQIIVLLGATALQGLIDPRAKISSLRGHWLEWQGFSVMPTYHPAALLRNPRLKASVLEDIQLIAAKYQELAIGNK